MIRLILAITLCLLAACAPAPPALSPIEQTATALQAGLAAQYTAQAQSTALVAQVTQSPIPDAQAAEPCMWRWATQPLGDATEAAQARINTAGLAGVTVNVSAYGENCLDSEGNIQYFAAMTSDFYVTVRTTSPLDAEGIGSLLVSIVDALIAEPPLELPARMGYFGLETMPAGTVRTTFDAIAEARAQGLSGAALLEALGGLR